MKKRADTQIQATLRMADRMIALSEQGYAACEDDGCLLLNGMLRECAYRIKTAAEGEVQARMRRTGG